MADSVWRSFLSSSDGEACSSSQPPRDVKMMLSAREEAKKAQEDAHTKEEQVALMTAMLQAAEEELKLRTNQLDITNAMLQATEAELVRKDEQLNITTQMLRKAEDEISKGSQERRALRQELAGLRDVVPRATVSIAPVTARTPSSYESTGTMETLVIDHEATSASEARQQQTTVEAAEAAGALAGELEAKLAQSFAQMGDYEETTRLHASIPLELPEQRERYGKERPPRVLLAHADAPAAMREKAAVPDARDTATYIQSRHESRRLPVTHTSMRIESGVDGEDDEDADEGYRRVHFGCRS